MMKYEIYNFDHRCKSPCKIETDSFRIIIDNQHCVNLEKLEKNASTTFTFDENITPIVVENEHQDGSFEVTAEIEVFDSKEESYLYRAGQEYQYIDDITLVLSFITGRRVYRKDEINRYSTKYYVGPPVSLNQITFRQINKKNIKKIKDVGLNVQFMNTVQSYSLNDLNALTCYCSASIDTISNTWSKKNGFSKYPNKNIINNAKKIVRDKILKSIFIDAKVVFLKFLKEDRCKEEIYKDIEARLGTVSAPSALYKLKRFFVSLGVYPEDDSKEHEEKLRWLNTVRNSVVHRGDLPKDKSLNQDNLSEIVANITFLMLAIIQLYYLKEILVISDCRLRETEQSLKSYFMTGRFRGKDVFNETYQEYMDRIKNDWSQRIIT